jgi:hypothetical protein
MDLLREFVRESSSETSRGGLQDKKIRANTNKIAKIVRAELRAMVSLIMLIYRSKVLQNRSHTSSLFLLSL